jgi:hypothetical protein
MAKSITTVNGADFKKILRETKTATTLNISEHRCHFPVQVVLKDDWVCSETTTNTFTINYNDECYPDIVNKNFRYNDQTHLVTTLNTGSDDDLQELRKLSFKRCHTTLVAIESYTAYPVILGKHYRLDANGVRIRIY